MSDFEIKTDLPMPPGAGRSARRIEYPLADLQVGQCILVPEVRRATLASRVKDFVNANPGWTFRGHALKEEKQHGFWCVARPDGPANQADIIPKRANERPALPSGIKPTPLPSVIRRESEAPDKPVTPTAHQKKLREAAKLQPIGKRQAHFSR